MAEDLTAVRANERPKSPGWQTVNVFVSSTFNDMHAERDYLVKEVFPALREWCEKRKLRLVDVDLRWGVTEADATRHKRVVDVCLRKIDDCRPFFVCLIGQRYGWIPKRGDVADQTLKDFPGLSKALEAASVTELEILHSCVEPMSNKQRAEHAFFYLREPSYVVNLPKDPAQLRRIYSDEAEAEPASRAFLKSKLDKLCDEKIPATGRPVHRYEAYWDPAQKTPEIAMPLACPAGMPENQERWRKEWREQAGVHAKGLDVGEDPQERTKAEAHNERLTSGRLGDFRCEKRTLGEVICEDLKAAIAARYPDHVEATGQTDLEREIELHEEFIHATTEGYIERQGDFDALDAWVEDASDRRLFALVAPGGIGKSTLLAKWVQRQRTKGETAVGGRVAESTALPSTRGSPSTGSGPRATSSGAETNTRDYGERGPPVIGRFIGVGDRSASVDMLLNFLVQELQSIGRLTTEVPEDPRKLRKNLPELLADCGKKGRTVIVIDALDQLESGLTDLDWLPLQLPENVKIVVSFKRGEPGADKLEAIWRLPAHAHRDRNPIRACLKRFLTKLKALTNTKPCDSGTDDQEESGRSNGRVLVHQHHDFAVQEDRKKLVRAYLEQYLKKLDEAHLNALVSAPGAENPLFLRVVLSELRVFGSFGALGEKIRRDFGETPVSAFDAVLNRLEHDPPPAGFDPQKVVPILFGLLAHSRGGLPKQAMVDILREELKLSIDHRPAIGVTVESYLRQVRPFLARREDRVDFFFTSFRVAAQTRYTVADGAADAQVKDRCCGDVLPRIEEGADTQAKASVPGKLGGSRTPIPRGVRTAGLETCHATPGEHCADALTLRSAEEWHHCLARWCNLWPEHDDAAKPYALGALVHHYLAAGEAEPAARAMMDFGYHHARTERLGANDVSEVTRDFSALVGAKLPADRRDCAEIWQRFHDQIAHFLRRPGSRPETELMQRAYAHAEASPVTWSAEAWLERGNSTQWWFRNLMRPKKIVRNPCLRVLEGHIGWVNSVALHADGRRAVSAGGTGLGNWGENTLRLWDLETGACLQALKGHTDAVISVALHVDGRRAVSGSHDQTLRVWDLETGACLRTLENTFCGRVVALHPDGIRALAGSRDSTLRVWDLETGACLQALKGHTRTVMSVALHVDGRRAVSGSYDQTLRVWDLETGTCLRVLKGHTGEVNSIGLHADGRRVVSASHDRTLRVWDLETGACLHVLKGHADDVNSVALHADGRRAVSGGGVADQTLRVWDLETGACLRVLKGHTGEVRSVALHADGRRALSASHDNTLRVWDLETVPGLLAQGNTTEAVMPVVLQADGRRALSASHDNTLRVWDLETGACLRALKGHTGEVKFVALHVDGWRAVSASLDRTLRVWDLETGACLRVLEGHIGWANSMWLHADGRRSVSEGGSLDNALRVWDLETGACLRVLEGHIGSVEAVALHADGRRAVSGGIDNTLRVWDLETGDCLCVLEGHTSPVISVALHADGRRAVSGGDQNSNSALRVWDLETGACLRVLEGYTESVPSVALHADGRRAVSWGSSSFDRLQTLRVWDIESGVLLRTLKGHTAKVTSVVLHADGRRAVSASHDDTVRVWDLETGACLGMWFGVSSFCTIGLGRPLFGRTRIAAGCDDGSVHFFELMPPGLLKNRTTLTAWNPTNSMIAAARDTGAVTLHQWHASAEHMEEIARTEPTGTPVASLCFSTDGTRLQVRDTNGVERIFDAATLRPAAPPAGDWAKPRDISPDGAWRVDLERGRVEVVRVKET